MDARKKRLVFLSILMSVAVYLLVFPRPLGEELLIRAGWSVPVDSAVQGGRPDTPLYHFSLGDRFGYVDAAGDLRSVVARMQGVAGNDDYFVNYSRAPDNMLIQEPSLAIRGVIREPGYPFVVRNRIYVVSPTMSGIAEWVGSSELRWRRQFPGIVTSLDGGTDRTVVGFDNGTAVILDGNGEKVGSFEPKGSRIPVTLGVAISDDDRFAAIVSGIDPQKITLLERNGPGYRELTQFLLKGDYRRRVEMHFLRETPWLVVEQPEEIALINAREKRMVRFPSEGEVYAISDSFRHGLVSLATRTEAGYTMVWVLTSGQSVVRFPVNRRGPAFFRSLPDGFLFGVGTRLYAVMTEEG